MPILITHGWPGSVIEVFKVIDPLTNPTAHGGRAEDAFHVIAPSLPGFAFSDKLATRGWNAERIAKAWAEVMHRLGYTRYVAQGGDWGAIVGCSIFPHEIIRPPRSWAERFFPHLIHWNEPARGGHFAAFEQPVVFHRDFDTSEEWGGQETFEMDERRLLVGIPP